MFQWNEDCFVNEWGDDYARRQANAEDTRMIYCEFHFFATPSASLSLAARPSPFCEQYPISWTTERETRHNCGAFSVVRPEGRARSCSLCSHVHWAPSGGGV